MSLWTPGRPDATEYAPFAETYVSLTTGGDPLSLLAAQMDTLLALLQPVDPEHAASYAYAPGKWTINQVLGHIIDGERVFTYRALWIARGGASPLEPFDENGFAEAAESSAVPLASLLDEYRAVRSATLGLFRNLPRAAWSKKGIASGHPASVRGIAFLTAGHELHHLRILKERYF